MEAITVVNLLPDKYEDLAERRRKSTVPWDSRLSLVEARLRLASATPVEATTISR